MSCNWRGNFADTWYLYCGPMVFICAISLLTLVKNTLNARPLPVLGFISRHSLGIYGFHALVIHALRTRGVELKSWPVLEYCLDIYRYAGCQPAAVNVAAKNRCAQVCKLTRLKAGRPGKR
jgi:hypothetical protein